MKYLTLAALLIFFSCSNNSVDPGEPSLSANEILDSLRSSYALLPEEAIVKSSDGRVYAQYAQPTEKYPHGVMGDRIEAEQLVVAVDGKIYDLALDPDYLFEDLQPRLYDVDNDKELEFITIRTHLNKGAGLAIYKVVSDQLVEYGFVPEIGTANRWLNPVTIHDVDDDGAVELIWIQTPHIGGILKVAKFNEGEMAVLAEEIQFSNHEGFDRNLCLSVLTEEDGKKVFYVPTQNRDKIVGFSFTDNKLFKEREIEFDVDFKIPLVDQYSFLDVIDNEVNCIDL